MKSKDLISIDALDRGEILEIFSRTKELKDKLKRGTPTPVLAGKTLGMIFHKPSTRTRVSFEVGMFQLGGHALYLGAGDLQLGRGETIADTARTLSRYLNGIMIRTFSHQDVIELANHASIPVINGLTDLLHPCQVLGDIYTVLEHFHRDVNAPRLDDIKVTFIGDGNNVANSWVEAAAKLDFTFTICSPTGFEPDREIWAAAKRAGAKLCIERDPAKAVSDADIIYTDVWASMGQEKEREKRLKIFEPFRVNGRLMSKAKKGARVMHCLPAHRGEEATDEVLDGPASIIFDQAENRLHVQKGIMALLLQSKV
ncbi:MAG: ornithine carbamoyltransferase [Candidatus Aureabacteria bacterium]|nr:ornithine carbamoyltransferase [Candidatus Auribacterota bacterium]